jgi:hypothetical protein
MQPMSNATSIVLVLIVALLVVTVASVRARSTPMLLATSIDEGGLGAYYPSEPVATPAKGG